MSLNVKGLGEKYKIDWVCRLKRENILGMIGIQETKLGESSPPFNAANCWGDSDCKFEQVFTTGRSGGIISIWDTGMFSLVEVIKSRHFIVTLGNVLGINGLIGIVNVYGPQTEGEKVKLWEELLKIKLSRSATWIFMGDFNVVRCKEERINSEFCSRSANAFNKFICDCELTYIKMGGQRFTYFRTLGAKLSKLDRFLVCSKFLSAYPQASCFAMNRDLSDHSLIVLRARCEDFGPPPFNFLNSWLSNDELDGVIKEACLVLRGYDTLDTILLNKLKYLKLAIRNWRVNATRKENNEIETWKNRNAKLKLIAKSRVLTEAELEERSNIGVKIDEHARLVTLNLKQRAKLKWEAEGDENKRFFHNYVNNRNRKNHIHGIMANGTWVTNPMDIKKEAVRFFGNKFKEGWKNRSKFYNPGFRKLSEFDTNFLEGEFTINEIKKAVWACGSEKSPGPDGFTFKFVKKYWELLKDDIVQMVKPISLTGSLYKIIAKLLAIRLKRVIGNIIDEVQSAYMEGRNILEGPLIVNDLCSWAKANGKKMLLFQADFNKAFDSISWTYLDSIMEQMGFESKWRLWMNGCLESSRASVIINGSPTKECSMSKGVRQGDPLSPFLFIITMEELNQEMKTAVEKGIFDGIKFQQSKLCLSHLFYTDDALFIGEWSRRNIANLAQILRCFYVSSGLKVNFRKSKVYGVGASHTEVINLATPLGCEPSSIPFTYLRIPVGENMNRRKAWEPIIDKFQAKMSTWKVRSLSFGGRLALAKAVPGNLPTFFMSIFVVPTGVIDTLERIRRKFIWSKEYDKKCICWVAWEKLISPWSVGGIGLGSIKSLNISLLAKWIWRLKTDSSALWANVIRFIHKLDGEHWSFLANGPNNARKNSLSGGTLPTWDYHSIYDVRCLQSRRGDERSHLDFVSGGEDGHGSHT
uniref:Reverse transcriptase domain-containing protein n=1 Tax=Lactuca sativa TaxID=4236 RepID=A0A9R1VF51_LACSA|nr:hypothetical protein LSAT_V11C500259620 [Lactuca sativa]